MIEMDDIRELQRQHEVFAQEIFAFLLENYKIEHKGLNRYEFFQPYIGKAVITISCVFRKEYRKIFSRLHKNLKYTKMVESYCMIVPVKKDERYFYYFLMRVSLIFELSLYCYKEGYDYFKIGQKCLAEYEDLHYFESVGSWGKLAHTALFIASLGQPLTLIMYPDYNDRGKIIQTFGEALSILDKHFIHTANLKMLDSAEMYCLTELNKMFETPTRKRKIAWGRNEQSEKENESFKDLKISPKQSFYYSKGSNCIIIAEYFKKCLLHLISSKALGYLVKNFDQENMSDVFNLSTVGDYENSARHFNGKFSTKKVSYIEQYKNISPMASPKRIKQLLEEEELRVALTIEEESPVLDIPQEDSSLHSPEKETGILVNIPLSLLSRYPKKNLPDMLTATSEDLNQKASNYKIDKNLDSKNEHSINPTFIVPNNYLRLKNTDDTLMSTNLYTVKMYPPSARKKLSEPMKKLLDENIENKNYNEMPSGDLLVCPSESSVNDTLIILTESSSDEEVDENTDILICLFKKLELDSFGSEKGYSLRPKQSSLLEKERSRGDLDEVGITGEKTASEEKSPLKTSRTAKCKQGKSIKDEKFYAKKLIRLYKRYFTSFLEQYLNIEFTTVVPKQCRNLTEYDGCKHGFAVTASVMAKRKVLLDEPDEKKRVIGIKLYEVAFQPKFLPFEVQRELDLQIRTGNYFAAPNGVYGVGPKHNIRREDIWVIFYTGNGDSNLVPYNEDDLKEIPKVFRSYEPVLKTFLSKYEEDTVKSDMDCFEILLNDLIELGFRVEQI